MARIVRADLDGHLRSSSHISKEYASRVVQKARQRLGKGGIVGVLRYDSPTEKDPRWRNFFDNLHSDTITTDNGRFLPEEDLLFVHGQEVKTKEGYEILVIGSPENSTVYHGLPGLETVQRAKDLGSYVVLAAPFHSNGMCTSPVMCDTEVIRNLDAIETFSGEAESSFGKYTDANKRAEEFFRFLSRDVPQLNRFVSTDNHSINELGRTYAEILMPDDYARYYHSPRRLMNDLAAGLKVASDKGTFVTFPAKIGAYSHVLDMIILGKTRKLLGWDPNTKTAPFLESFGIHV